LPLDFADPERPKPGKPELFLASKSLMVSPEFSPDGRWIAYTSQETQPPQIFVRPFPGNNSGSRGKWQISTDGGTNGSWSRNGGEFVYLAGGSGPQVASYTVRAESFVMGQSRPWSDKWRPVTSAQGPPALMPDGKRFVVIMSASQPTAEMQTHVNFLLNFSDELRRRVPVGK
jgi:Tol biopolymer transport system component